MIDFDDFYAIAPANRCVYRPTRDLWLNEAVDKRLPRQPLLDANGNPVRDSRGRIKTISPTERLAKERSAERTVWVPGEPEVIRGKLAIDTGWIEKSGATSYNLYLPPNAIPGDAAQATRWVEHWNTLYPNEADHIISWLAHRRQYPGIKPNHCLVLVGSPEIGKDTLLYPMRDAVGPWNFHDITLNHLVSPHNDFLCATIIRINEARDIGDINRGKIDRYSLHDHMKALMTSPPETHRINRKYIPQYVAFSRMGFIITTNHSDALYLPDDDRRHLVGISEIKRPDLPRKFFDDFYNWYDNEGGIGHVIAYLQQRNLSNFNSKQAPLKTTGFWGMVHVDYGPDHSELVEAIDALSTHDEHGNIIAAPAAVTIAQLVEKVPSAVWLIERKMSRVIPHRLRRCGYVRVANPDAPRNDGLWRINSKQIAIYAREDLRPPQRMEAAIDLRDALTQKKPKLTLVNKDGE
jgi:hypothetical protein